jgi:hypothetical protein
MTMEDEKYHCEQSEKGQAITQINEIEELERREAPKLAANHNETMLQINA